MRAASTPAPSRCRAPPPDGYTLLVSPPLPLTVANLLYRDITYQPAQFVPVSLLAKIPNVLSVRNSFPAKNVKELVAFGKANPGKITYASQGPGSTAHLSGAQLEVRAGIKMVHVPYRGAAPAINDLIAGHIDIFFDTLTTSVPLWRSDKIKILAVASDERFDAVKELPTIAESGFPGFRSITWFAMAGPPKMPAALADRINRDVVEILKRPEFDKRLRDLAARSDDRLTRRRRQILRRRNRALGRRHQGSQGDDPLTLQPVAWHADRMWRATVPQYPGYSERHHEQDPYCQIHDRPGRPPPALSVPRRRVRYRSGLCQYRGMVPVDPGRAAAAARTSRSIICCRERGDRIRRLCLGAEFAARHAPASRCATLRSPRFSRRTNAAAIAGATRCSTE